MTVLPGLTWEYIAFNIDLYRLAHLNCEWELRPNQSAMMRSMESMFSQWAGFEKKSNLKKEDLSDGEIITFDPSKWKVISTQQL